MLVAAVVGWAIAFGVPITAYGGLIPDGDRGNLGQRGRQGDQGNVGSAPQGAQGAEGPRGPVGPKGPTAKTVFSRTSTSDYMGPSTKISSGEFKVSYEYSCDSAYGGSLFLTWNGDDGGNYEMMDVEGSSGKDRQYLTLNGPRGHFEVMTTGIDCTWSVTIIEVL
jgi:hypothetical protein